MELRDSLTLVPLDDDPVTGFQRAVGDPFEGESVLFRAAELVDEFEMTGFDAYCAAYAGGDSIVSSDGAYDDVPGVSRLALDHTDGGA